MNAIVLYFLLLRATALSFSGFASVPVIREDLVVTRASADGRRVEQRHCDQPSLSRPSRVVRRRARLLRRGSSWRSGRRARVGFAGHSRHSHRSRRAAPSGLTSPRRLRGHCHRVVRADGDNERALGARGGAESSICVAGGRWLHRAGFGSRAASPCDPRCSLPWTVLDVSDR